MSHLRYNIKWVGRCQYGTSDKIWGWFYYNDPTSAESPAWNSPAYVFWAERQKPLHVKKHASLFGQMDKLIRQKKDRKYTEIEVKSLLEIWPSFYQDLDNRFIFFMLVGD